MLWPRFFFFQENISFHQFKKTYQYQIQNRQKGSDYQQLRHTMNLHMLEPNQSSSSCSTYPDIYSLETTIQKPTHQSILEHQFGLNACQTIFVLVLRCRYLHTHQAHAFTTFDLHIHQSFPSFPSLNVSNNQNIPQLQYHEHKIHQTLATLFLARHILPTFHRRIVELHMHVCKESRWMILCSGLDMTVRVCMYVCEREREREREKMYIETENRIRKLMYFTKEKDSTILQGGRRVLYIVTLSLH